MFDCSSYSPLWYSFHVCTFSAEYHVKPHPVLFLVLFFSLLDHHPKTGNHSQRISVKRQTSNRPTCCNWYCTGLFYREWTLQTLIEKKKKIKKKIKERHSRKILYIKWNSWINTQIFWMIVYGNFIISWYKYLRLCSADHHCFSSIDRHSWVQITECITQIIYNTIIY